MMDFYMSNDNAIRRLVDEWKKYGKIVIAYDFDDTVYDFHHKGHTFDQVITLLRECRKWGAHLIVYTANNDTDFIKRYLSENDIPYDYINEQPPHIPIHGGKLYYNILLDDRAGLQSAFHTLSMALWYYAKLDESKNK